jgi:hypothetical protein
MLRLNERNLSVGVAVPGVMFSLDSSANQENGFFDGVKCSAFFGSKADPLNAARV